MSETLRHCPFCGGEAIIDKSDYRFPDGTHALDGYSARCIGCGARTCEYKTELLAADAWNRRAERTCRVVTMDMAGEPPYHKGSLVLDALSDGCSNCGARVVDE